MRRTWLLDVISGNTDRHEGNLLVAPKFGGGLRVVAIDNGLAFPSRRGGNPFRLSDDLGFQHIPLELDGFRAELVKKLDLEEMTEELLDAGLDAEAVKAAVVRARALQLDANAIGKRWHEPDRYVIEQWIDDSFEAPRSPKALLPPDEHRRVWRMVDAADRKRKK